MPKQSLYLQTRDIDKDLLGQMTEFWSSSDEDEERGKKENKQVWGVENSRLMRFHSVHVDVFCLPAMVDVAERVIHRYHVSARSLSLPVYRLLDEYDLLLYSSFFSILFYFFFFVGKKG